MDDYDASPNNAGGVAVSPHVGYRMVTFFLTALGKFCRVHCATPMIFNGRKCEPGPEAPAWGSTFAACVSGFGFMDLTED
jgi:hypothetical protein